MPGIHRQLLYVTYSHPSLPITCSSGDATRRGLHASTLGSSSMATWVQWLNIAQCSSTLRASSRITQARCCTAAAPQTSLLIRLAAPTSLTPSRLPQEAKVGWLDISQFGTLARSRFRVILDSETCSNPFSSPCMKNMHVRLWHSITL